MCSKRQILSPSGSLFNKNRKYVDPLGITKTAVGDPTGGIRKETAKVEAEKAAAAKAKADVANQYPNALAAAADAANETTATSLNARLKRRSAFAVSLLNQGGGQSLLASGGRS